MNSVEFYFEDIDPISIHENILNLQLKSLIKKELKEVGDITVIFCSDEYLLEMNKEYLNHDYYTDIITFDYVEGDIISGDLFISVDRVKDNAVQFDSTLLKELYRVVFHGTLHLVGYKDKTEDEKVVMRSKEDFYLSEVDFKGLEK
ncbi:rRNA maturation RNase YbeY [Maribellus luteus]|uniref:Endoribonuclease YbeY n=1 Tax=Maribellus luteus TaxID=2305463 RepID=A0A399T1H4_9BACT|nr:rRNA maturation RNase YbeY [Maribellus luteus]RIJ48642.1 rRNA maturation RNase YbeY [Maribellus luteus]